MRRDIGLWFLVCCLCWTSARAQAAPADSLVALEGRLKVSEYVALGDSCLRAETFKEAESAYRKALDLDKGSVEAQYGLAQVYFKDATKRGLMAMLQQRRAFGAVRQLVEHAPQFAPAYLLYGLCYEWLQGEYERSITYYEKYLKMRPDDPEGLLGLGRACVEIKRYRRVQDLVLPYAQQHPEERRLLPIVGQYLLAHGSSKEALEAFAKYVEGLGPEERALYEDIRWVASREELGEYQGLPEAERPAFLKRFWARRDADILTEINEGLIEHYRRVWYARNYFGRLIKPWDRRGEVYIRYGEPNYRARSNRRGAYQSPAVQQVKERLAQALYGADSVEEIYTGPVFPIRSTLADASLDNTTPPLPTAAELPGETPGQAPDTQTNPDQRLDEDPQRDVLQAVASTGFAPVTLRSDQSMVAWESWVYAGLAGGIEVTFTDEMGNGNYDFAPMPTITLKDAQDMKTLGRMSRLLEFAPKTLVDKAMATTPDEYRIVREGINLGFYYATSDFKGQDGATRLEVDYGLPTKEFTSFTSGDTVSMVVERAVALAAKDHSRVYRSQGEVVLQGQGGSRKAKGEFIPDLVRLELPPGEYHLAIQIKDKVSGKTGLYKQELKVKPYTEDRLLISDISMAFAILDSAAAPQFRKGNVWVLPMPSRTYGEGQSAAAYYEVYNLRKDDRGHTRYKVEYSIRTDMEPGYGVLGKTASGFQKLFGGNKPQVAVTYERAGTEANDAGYFSLDLKRVKPGINRMKVTVTDLVSQETTERETIFRYAGKEK
ncbi:MAG: GWxTD domain-containing protein [Candidatus Latescibacteria bacterium]|nr:GWxTD domain-containing protein [Candidatus Latescibacterota bacterium]